MKRKKAGRHSGVAIAKPKDYSNYTMTSSIGQNEGMFKDIFKDDETLIIRQFENQHDRYVKCCVLFIDGMVNNEIINENVMRPVIENSLISNIPDQDTASEDADEKLKDIKDYIIVSNDVTITDEVGKLIDAIVRGDTVFLLDGSAQGLIINTKGWQTRSIEEPPAERLIIGPREGFVETLLVNLSLIRRKIATPDLKFKFIKLGAQTRTKICVCYIDGIVNKKILNEVYKRINTIDIDSVLDTEYIREYIKDAPFSPFLTNGSTERPDVVAANILEGRIAIMVDGSPIVLTIPYAFVENFQSNEDYYIEFPMSSLNRLLRIAGFWISISLPGVYVALVTYHQEAIPTPLLLSISAARQGVPFPTIVEIVLLTVVFDMLRDAGVRMPSNLGQALSIVGALVLGSASVEAKIVSAPIVIVVSVTAITSLMVPKLTAAISELRPVLLLLSAFLGLYGYIFGIMGILIYLCSLRSFGIPYMMQISSLAAYDLKDTAIVAPRWYMKYRPKLISLNRVRMGSGGRKSWAKK